MRKLVFGCLLLVGLGWTGSVGATPVTVDLSPFGVSPVANGESLFFGTTFAPLSYGVGDTFDLEVRFANGERVELGSTPGFDLGAFGTPLGGELLDINVATGFNPPGTATFDWDLTFVGVSGALGQASLSGSSVSDALNLARNGATQADLFSADLTDSTFAFAGFDLSFTLTGCVDDTSSPCSLQGVDQIIASVAGEHVAIVPEPGTSLLVAAGLVAVLASGRRRPA